ncbi:hypothetical protein GQ53DRAFT_160663 [Thozetella sp. PMI_491]|nr:hypothetical protein GQ53DRAFT_160663 [Thozetella sp. PMI_491]
MAAPTVQQPLAGALFPYATAPDIIRAHQKDAYFQGVLTNQLSDLHRRLRGARSAHAWATESGTAADLLYLCLTTLLGNRTLGEEYCDLVQVETPSAPRTTVVSATGEHEEPRPDAALPQLPSLQRRAAYIATSVLAPYLAHRLLPSFRAAWRARLQNRLTALKRQGRTDSVEYRVRRYVLAHLSTLTSGAHVHAVTLAVFYFTGAYYSLAKRLVGLRYVFTRHLPEGPAGSGDGRAGYEVLGVLLVVQMVVRGYLHINAQLSAPLSESEAGIEAAIRERVFGAAHSLDVSLDENSYASNNGLLLDGGAPAGSSGQRSLAEIGTTMHTPVVGGGRPRYFLAEGGTDNQVVMGWIKGAQQRKCTLCLEELKDPAATQCGHVFCWTCIGDWVREKPECPLCRREAMLQHILPLRAA